MENIMTVYAYVVIYFTTLFCTGFEGIYQQLNPEYRQPISHNNGPLLVNYSTPILRFFE
jgi:hypothetical protein